MNQRVPRARVQFRVGLWWRGGFRLLATETAHMPRDSERAEIFTALSRRFEQRYGHPPNERRIIQYTEGRNENS